MFTKMELILISFEFSLGILQVCEIWVKEWSSILACIRGENNE
jgi:hypothetical protein